MINSTHFYREISHNLSILESTLDKIENPTLRAQGEIIEGPDLGFIEILLEDIERLKASGFDKYKIGKLSARLEGAASRMTDCANKVFGREQSEDVQIPYIRNKISSKELSKDYANGAIKAGLEILDKDYEVIRIRGDGHCLFRSVAAGLLFSVASDPEVIPKLLNKLEEEEESLKNSSFIDPSQFEYFKRILEMVVEDSNPQEKVYEIMANGEFSNGVVEFLRKLACAFKDRKAQEELDFGEVLNAEALASDFPSVADYLNAMVAMDNKKEGGDPELQALSNALNLNLHILKPQGYGKYDARKGEFNDDPDLEKRLRDDLENHVESGRDPIATIDLLYRPGHYDLAVPKEYPQI